MTRVALFIDFFLAGYGGPMQMKLSKEIAAFAAISSKGFPEIKLKPIDFELYCLEYLSRLYCAYINSVLEIFRKQKCLIKNST